MPLPREHLLDELATAYVQAVAAAAGATIAVSRDYGVDGTLKPIVRTDDGRYVETGFAADFQLKGTTTALIGEELVRYDLNVRNYDLIVTREERAVPYFLFVVCFPSDPREWVVEHVDRLILNATAFWWTRRGERSTNTASVRVEIPLANRLTFGAVENILRQLEHRYV